MNKPLPKKLKNTPIVESIFEIQYSSLQDVSGVLPGIIHGALLGHKLIHPTPPIPVDIIKSDPNMFGVPTFSIEWEKFIILGNPHFVAISFKTPYTGWLDFKAGIEKIHTALVKEKVFSSITRFSLKYIDFIELPSENNFLDFLNLEVKFQGKLVEKENLIINFEFKDDKYFNALKLATNAKFVDNLKKETKSGLLVDTDTIYIPSDPLEPSQFMENYNTFVDQIHKHSKKLFFDTLSEKAINYLGPEYDT